MKRPCGSSHVVIALAFFFSAFHLGGCSAASEEEETELGLRVPCPLILVHGLGGSASGWQYSGMVGFLKDKGLVFGGDFEFKDGGLDLEVPDEWQPRADFYAIDIVDAFDSLEQWKIELRAVVLEVLRLTGAPKVVLVGFSAGGLASRAYLVEWLDDHKVAKLVTVSSPHLGSELAYLALLKDTLIRDAAGRGPTSMISKVALNKLSGLEEKVGVELGSELVRQLVPERDNEFLQKLNRSEHPRDIDYSAVVVNHQLELSSSRELYIELSKLKSLDESSQIVSSAANMIMRWLGSLDGVESEGGDGAVLVESQNILNVEFFRENRPLVSSVIKVSGQHRAAKSLYGAIVRAVSGAIEFRHGNKIDDSSGGNAKFYFYYQDYLAGASSVRVFDRSSEEEIFFSGPTVCRYLDESYARLTIGPVSISQSPVVTVAVRPYGSEKTFFQDVVVGRPEGLPGKWKALGESKAVSIVLERIESVPTSRQDGSSWDVLGVGKQSLPDIEVSLLVNHVEVANTRSFLDVERTVHMGEELEFSARLDESQIRLMVWDADPLAADFLGEVIFNPGDLTLGKHKVSAEGSGVVLWIDVSFDADRTEDVEQAEPFFLS